VEEKVEVMEQMPQLVVQVVVERLMQAYRVLLEMLEALRQLKDFRVEIQPQTQAVVAVAVAVLHLLLIKDKI
jgi:hypothetical protein